MALDLKINAKLANPHETEVSINGVLLRDVRSIRFSHGPYDTPHAVVEVFTGKVDDKGEPEVATLTFGVGRR